MTEEEFWNFIADLGASDADALVDEFKGKLLCREPSEILELKRHWFVVQERAYTWPVWDGACLLLDWIGDDSFMDLRAWLVTLGKDKFFSVIANPDNLADYVGEIGDSQLEAGQQLADAFDEAYMRITGVEPPVIEHGEEGKVPNGERTELSDSRLVKLRFPRLAELRLGE